MRRTEDELDDLLDRHLQEIRLGPHDRSSLHRGVRKTQSHPSGLRLCCAAIGSRGGYGPH